MNTSTTDVYGREAPSLTPEGLATLKAVLEQVSSARGQVKSLDMGDATQRQFVLDRLGGEEFLERYFPSVRNMVETARTDHESCGGPGAATLREMDDPALDEWHPLVEISYLGLEPDGVRIITQGIVTLPGMAASITSNLLLMDLKTGKVLASKTVPTQYNLGTQVSDLTGLLPPGTSPSDVVAVLTAQYLQAGATLSTQVAATAALSTMQAPPATDARSDGALEEEIASPIQTVTVTNPNHNSHPERTYIKVGLNRQPNGSGDCDYYYQFGTEGSKPVVGLQVSGSATLINGYTVSAAPNFNGDCLLIRRSATGDGATLAFPKELIPEACQGSGSAVSWNIGPDWFKGAPWDQGDVVDLDFSLNFSVQPGGAASLRVTSVPQGVETTPSNIATIDPIKFVWGCVAAGSLVRMEDGGMRRIETLTAGERVADGRGGGLRIAEVWTGREDKPLYRLATASGAEALLTEGHAVPTGNGVVAACELTVGMVVTTEQGDEALTVVERVSHDGSVVNLDLLPDGADSLSDIDDDAITPFVVGGMTVGDNRMQGVLVKRAIAAPGPDPLETHGPEWRLDIVNSRRMQAGLPLVERLSA